MTPEVWTMIGTGIVILLAIAISHRQLRAELKAFHDELLGEMRAHRNEFRAEVRAHRNEFRAEMDGYRNDHGGQITGPRGEMREIRAELGAIRERMAMLEGLLVGLREAITGRQVA